MKVVLPAKDNHFKGTKMAKILIIDIETSPIMGKVWSLWKQNVSLDQIESDWYIMSFAAKWYGEDEVIYRDCRNSIGNDTEMLSDIFLLLEEADIVVAHNAVKFDVPKIKARLILNDFPPPSPFKVIDTLGAVKRTFKFTSNKLAYLTDKLTETKKLDHAKFSGFKLWNECMDGNEEAWEEMRVYNEADVLSLEELYTKLIPWIDNHPNINIYKAVDDMRCPKCGSNHIVKKGHRYTNKGKYQRYHCRTCNGYSSGTYAENTLAERKQLLTSM